MSTWLPDEEWIFFCWLPGQLWPYHCAPQSRKQGQNTFFSLLPTHVRPGRAIHVIERGKTTGWGVFPCSLLCVLLRAAVPAHAASHPNFAPTCPGIFLECPFRLFQICLADSLQDSDHEKKGSIQGKQQEFRPVSVNMWCRHLMKYCGYPWVRADQWQYPSGEESLDESKPKLCTQLCWVLRCAVPPQFSLCCGGKILVFN